MIYESPRVTRRLPDTSNFANARRRSCLIDDKVALIRITALPMFYYLLTAGAIAVVVLLLL